MQGKQEGLLSFRTGFISGRPKGGEGKFIAPIVLD